MQLNLTTDYAIRIVLYLATQTAPVSSKELSQSLGVPPSYVLKTARRLAEAGLVTASVGVRGGLALGRAPEDITLLDIIRVMENTIQLNRCLEPDCYCSRSAVESCPVRKVYTAVQKQMEKTLSSMTIRSLLEGGTPGDGKEAAV